MHEMRQKEDSMKVRIELWIFVQHPVKFCLRKIMRTLCELLIHQKMLNTKRLNVILKKSFINWKMKNRSIHIQFAVSNNKLTIMKPAVLNQIGKNIDRNITPLLNLRPNIVLTPKSIPCMDSLTTTDC